MRIGGGVHARRGLRRQPSAQCLLVMRRGSGRRNLAEPSSSTPQPTSTTNAKQSQQTTSKAAQLPQEPLENETAGVCTVQIRGGGIGTNSGKRRFNTNTFTMDLFSFAYCIKRFWHGLSSFRLITPFPTKVYKPSSSAEDSKETECYEANWYCEWTDSIHNWETVVII